MSFTSAAAAGPCSPVCPHSPFLPPSFIPALHMNISFTIPWSTALQLPLWKCNFIILVLISSSLRSWGPNSCWKTSLKLLLKHIVAFLTIGLQLAACRMTAKTFFFSPTRLTAVFSVLLNSLIPCCHSLPSQEWPILALYNCFLKHSDDPRSHTLSAFG